MLKKIKLIENRTKLLLNNYVSYYKSKHWKRYDLRKKLINSSNLSNFRNNGLSSGLDDQHTKSKIKEFYQKLRKKVPLKFIIKNLLRTNIGNLLNYLNVKYKNTYLNIDYGQFFFIYWLFLVKKIIKKKEIKYICEIGAGYGGFSAKIIKYYPNAKYLIIDLPEANFLSCYFLSKVFPNKRILLAYKKKIINKSDFNKYDVIIIPPWFRVCKIKFDLFINTRSMMEMNKNTIFEYFKFIHNNISANGYFLNINRYFKNSVEDPLKLTSYPYDDKWNVLFSKPAWQQRHIRVLLTKRTTNPKNNIHKEFKKLKKITNSYFLKETKTKKSLGAEIYWVFKRKCFIIYEYFKDLKILKT